MLLLAVMFTGPPAPVAFKLIPPPQPLTVNVPVNPENVKLSLNPVLTVLLLVNVPLVVYMFGIFVVHSRLPVPVLRVRNSVLLLFKVGAVGNLNVVVVTCTVGELRDI